MKSDLIKYFAIQRQIFGLCTCCGEIFRLSNANVYMKKKPSVDWMTKYDQSEFRLDKMDDKINLEKSEVKQISREKGMRLIEEFENKRPPSLDIFLDFIALVAPIGIFLGRIANFINSELYGRETDIIWSVKFVAIDNVSRHPSQIYEAIFEGLVLFFLLNHFAKKDNFNKPGLISCLFIILYSLFRFILEFFRAPDTQVGYLFFQLTLGQLFSIVFFFLGLFLYLVKRNEN